jgi:hypothetical protein
MMYHLLAEYDGTLREVGEALSALSDPKDPE